MLFLLPLLLPIKVGPIIFNWMHTRCTYYYVQKGGFFSRQIANSYMYRRANSRQVDDNEILL